MRINFKQEELVENLMNAIKARFPEVRLIDITESPEDPETLRLNITAPDDDTKMSLVSFACDKATDIFLDYGYYFLVMPTRTRV